MENRSITLRETYEMLGIPWRTSKTLENMSIEDIANMTPEQAKKICSEVGYGWAKDAPDAQHLDFKLCNGPTINLIYEKEEIYQQEEG